MSDKTRPSAIVEEVGEASSIEDASVAELLTVCIKRASEDRALVQDSGRPRSEKGEIGRELSIAITHMEDAITRFNKATYRMKGTFAISDAERSHAAG